MILGYFNQLDIILTTSAGVTASMSILHYVIYV